MRQWREVASADGAFAGIHGVTPAFTANQRWITLRRIPEKPRDRLLIFSTIISRARSSSSGSPTPAAWDSTSERCRFSRSSVEIRVCASQNRCDAVGGTPFGKDGVDAGHALVNGGKRAAVEGNIYRVAVNVAELRQAELTRDQS